MKIRGQGTGIGARPPSSLAATSLTAFGVGAAHRRMPDGRPIRKA